MNIYESICVDLDETGHGKWAEEETKVTESMWGKLYWKQLRKVGFFSPMPPFAVCLCVLLEVCVVRQGDRRANSKSNFANLSLKVQEIHSERISYRVLYALNEETLVHGT